MHTKNKNQPKKSWKSTYSNR